MLGAVRAKLKKISVGSSDAPEPSPAAAQGFISQLAQGLRATAAGNEHSQENAQRWRSLFPQALHCPNHTYQQNPILRKFAFPQGIYQVIFY